jgi:serine/threonine-protein kinase RIM15
MADSQPSTQSNHVIPAQTLAVTALKQQAPGADMSRIAMERTLSEDIREEREDLKEAAEFTLTVVVDLSLDGIVRFVSPSWVDVVGSSPETVIGHPIADLLVSEKDVFSKAAEAIRKDDARSQNVRFSLMTGALSIKRRKQFRKDGLVESPLEDPDSPTEDFKLDLEGQGIMVYDRSTGEESHVSSSSSFGSIFNANRYRPCGCLNLMWFVRSQLIFQKSWSNPWASELKFLPNISILWPKKA